MTRSISTVDADSHMGEYSRYRQSMSIHLRENTVDIRVHVPSQCRSTCGKLRSIVDRRLNIEIIFDLEEISKHFFFCRSEKKTIDHGPRGGEKWFRTPEEVNGSMGGEE